MADSVRSAALRRALEPLAHSPLMAGNGENWMHTWVEFMPATIPVEHVSTAASYCAASTIRVLTLPLLIAYCERAEHGEAMAPPHFGRTEETAAVLLTDLLKRYPSEDRNGMADALILAACMMSAAEYVATGVDWTEENAVELFGGRARMFASLSPEWAADARRGVGIWRSLLSWK
jgi:hypothetical protein